MIYKVDKFNIILTREFQELEEKEIKATKVINMKPSFFEEFNKKGYPPARRVKIFDFGVVCSGGVRGSKK